MKRRRNIQIISVFLIGIIMNSCGVFLQKTGIKNYSLKEKIDRKKYNDYQYDFVYLSRLLDEGFPQIDSVFPKRKRIEEKNQILNALSKNNLKNVNFILQTRKYLSNFHSQHTNINLKTKFPNVYPFVIHISYNNWYLLNIEKKQDSSLIGKKIIKINEIDINEIEKKLYGFTFGENKICKQSEIQHPGLYNKPLILKEINVIQKLTDNIKITFADNSSVILEPIQTNKKIKIYNITIPSNKITKPENKTYFYEIYPKQNFGYLQFNKCHDKIDILDGINNYVKPWLQPLAKGYVKHQFKKEKPSKKIADYYNPKYPIFKDFVWELIDSLNNNNIKNLVIDLRNNNGGNFTLGIQLMYFLTNKTDLKNFTEYAFTSDIYKRYFPIAYKELEKQYPKGISDNKLIQVKNNKKLFNEITTQKSKYYIPKNRPFYKGKVYIIANYGTGSAAAMLTTLLQDNKIGIIIGTSVGNNPTGATTYTPMELPKTKANISIATTYQERPDKNKGEVQIPDYWVEYSISDLMTGRDPYLEKIKELIKKASR